MGSTQVLVQQQPKKRWKCQKFYLLSPHTGLNEIWCWRPGGGGILPVTFLICHRTYLRIIDLVLSHPPKTISNMWSWLALVGEMFCKGLWDVLQSSSGTYLRITDLVLSHPPKTISNMWSWLALVGERFCKGLWDVLQSSSGTYLRITDLVLSHPPKTISNMWSWLALVGESEIWTLPAAFTSNSTLVPLSWSNW